MILFSSFFVLFSFFFSFGKDHPLLFDRIFFFTLFFFCQKKILSRKWIKNDDDHFLKSNKRICNALLKKYISGKRFRSEIKGRNETIWKTLARIFRLPFFSLAFLPTNRPTQLHSSFSNFVDLLPYESFSGAEKRERKIEREAYDEISTANHRHCNNLYSFLFRFYSSLFTSLSDK